MVLWWSLVTHEGLGYTGSQEAARHVLEVLGWSPVTHEWLYIIIQAVSTLLNGTLVVEWGPGVLEWSSARAT